eukprot:scaffold56454_cov51-Phaeocystis_antarctica.AAC.1
MDARIAAYLDGAPIQPLTSAAASAASAVASAASAVAPHISAERAQLAQRLYEHMAAHDLSQVQVAKAANLTSTGKLGLWLGRSAQTLAAASMLETDTRIAAYLDGAPIPPTPTSTSAASATSAPLGSATKAASARLASAKASRAEAAEAAEARLAEAEARRAEAAEAASARRASTASAAAFHLPAERAQLVQRLEEHMATHGTSQNRVASAAGISSSGKLCMWLGRAALNTMSTAATAETDTLIA